MTKIVTRKNIRTMPAEERDDLVRAFAGIQKLEPTDPNSFFMIAGYHGEPFRGAGWGNPQWWGGYCNHGNVLFPTWHRAYLHRLERALQTIVPGVAMAYWDETEEWSLKNGIPEFFLTPTYTCKNGEVIDPNPLHSYTFQANITDHLSPLPDTNYSKGVGYQTVRYPFSGLVGTPKLKKKSEAHNKQLTELGVDETNKMLNLNILTWLNQVDFQNNKGKTIKANVSYKYGACLNAPNYTVFSNTTSAQQWNDDRIDNKGYVPIVPLESPHNSIHLAVGGFQLKKQHSDFNQYSGANGDMGENDTAAFDVRKSLTLFLSDVANIFTSSRSSSSTTALSISCSTNGRRRMTHWSHLRSFTDTRAPTPSTIKDRLLVSLAEPGSHSTAL